MKNALAAAAATLLLLSACGGANTPNSDGGTPDAGGTYDGGSGATAADAAAAYASFQCATLACVFGVSPGSCATGADFGIFSGGPFDVERSVSEGRTRYDANVGTACLAAIQGVEGLACAGESSPFATAAEGIIGSDGTSPCNGMFKGAVANGAACYDSLECAAGFCDFGENACPGACAPRLANGAPCEENEQCQVGSSCTFGSSGQACQPTVVRQQGAPCSYSSECADGLYCGDSGTCTNAKVANGAECKVDAQCAEGSACLKAGAFDPTGTCTVKVGAGGACATGGAFIFPYSNACKGLQVCAGLVLDGGSVEQPGTCRSPGGLGANCFPEASGTLGGSGCYADLACDPASSKCAAPPAAGSPCIDFRCARGAYCNASGQCVAQKADGATCENSGECVNRCDTSAGTPGVCVPEQSTECVP